MQFIIDFVDTVTEDQVSAYFTANKCTVLKTFSAFDKTYLVKASKKPTTNELITSIIKDGSAAVKLLNYEPAEGDQYPKITFDSHADTEWWKMAAFGQPDFDAPTQTYERRGQTATVYVVDSGINSDHPEFEFAEIEHLHSFNGDFTDANGHGTAIASLIAGKTCGVTAAKVVSVKLFQKGVDTLQSDFIEAINAIIVHNQTNTSTFPIVNLSWEIAKNEYIEDKIRLLIQSGVFVVASAGNGGVAIDDVTPASMPEVITVGSYGMDLTPSNFSNYTGPISTTPDEVNHGALDLWAPGEVINVATLTGNIGLASGTSLSAAIVSAALAYNSNVFMLADNTLPSVLLVDTTVLGFASAKANVLTLEGKYTESVNLSVCLRGEYDGDNGANYATISTFTIAAQSGSLIEKLTFNTLVVDNYNIEKPLPEGVSIDANGWLVGTINTTEPFLWESNLTYTKKNGHVHNAKMVFAIIPEGTNVEDLPQEDPVVKYTLSLCNKTYNSQVGRYYCDGGCTGGGMAGYCHDACNSSGKFEWDMYCTCGDDYCP